MVKEYIAGENNYNGTLKTKSFNELKTKDVFEAYEQGDSIAIQVFNNCIELWGMTVANLVSIFNPEKIIFGGGVFGPATRFLNEILNEAKKWAQPISITKVTLETSALGGDAGLIGAGYCALKSQSKPQ
jgi:glucokinase